MIASLFEVQNYALTASTILENRPEITTQKLKVAETGL